MKNGLEIGFSGGKYWYKDDLLHREDGPAMEYPSGVKYWFINGKKHREDGPAIEDIDRKKYWYLNGERIFVKSNEEFLRLVKLKALW